ncbi:hypothetical protein PR003_g33222 [Phytophthora rubi]|uniref:Uncharacterized protein n=1 Tax=Phytophthora rubi TaxID=129364 RepID=A0A6A4AZS7_9STRA|nr:hypothetical protein PR003_g33222 [Phytophthora rubi]
MIVLTGQMTLEDAGTDFLGDRTDADNAEILALRVYYKHSARHHHQHHGPSTASADLGAIAAATVVRDNAHCHAAYTNSAHLYSVPSLVESLVKPFTDLVSSE